MPEGSDVDRVFRASVVGSPETVRRLLDEFVGKTQADELIIATQIYDHQARLRSYEIVAAAMLGASAAAGSGPMTSPS